MAPSSGRKASTDVPLPMFLDGTSPQANPKPARKPRQAAQQPTAAPVRRRTIDPDRLSTVLDDDTNWRLSLYHHITGYGVKDAVVKASIGALGLGPYPRPLRAAQIQAAVSEVPFEVSEDRKFLSVRVDPELAEHVLAHVEDQQTVDEKYNKATWVKDTLRRFFDQLGLPSRVSD